MRCALNMGDTRTVQGFVKKKVAVAQECTVSRASVQMWALLYWFHENTTGNHAYLRYVLHLPIKQDGSPCVTPFLQVSSIYLSGSHVTHPVPSLS